jgi:primosomal protein N' (replication factor Y)
MEKTYQLLQQVAGRSGREVRKGKVLIQTYNPQHPIFESIKNQNRDDFISMELSRREQNNLPPYTKIAQLQLIHPKSQIFVIFAWKFYRSQKNINYPS